MANNNLYTKSYFKKRLYEAGIRVSDVWSGREREFVLEYDDADERYWTVLIDGGNTNILCTCVRSGDEIRFNFVYPGCVRLDVITQSMGTVLATICGVIDNYNKKDN